MPRVNKPCKLVGFRNFKSSDWLIKIGRLTNQSSSESLSGTIESIGGHALDDDFQTKSNSNA